MPGFDMKDWRSLNPIFDVTDLVDLSPKLKHSNSCHLAEGKRWDNCICLIIDRGDNPCASCIGVQGSAPRCKACRVIAKGRKAYVKAARSTMRKKR